MSHCFHGHISSSPNHTDAAKGENTQITVPNELQKALKLNNQILKLAS